MMSRKSMLVFSAFMICACGQQTRPSAIQSDGFEGRGKNIKNAFNALSEEVGGLAGGDTYEGEASSGGSCQVKYQKMDVATIRLGFFREQTEVGFFVAKRDSTKGFRLTNGDSYKDHFSNGSEYTVEVTIVDDAFNVIALKRGNQSVLSCEQYL